MNNFKDFKEAHKILTVSLPELKNVYLNDIVNAQNRGDQEAAENFKKEYSNLLNRESRVFSYLAISLGLIEFENVFYVDYPYVTISERARILEFLEQETKA
jgi:hypothetical protein